MGNEGKKYVLTDETIDVEGHVLHRIRAIRSFKGVTEGMYGGYVENEENLSHEGTCWISGCALVYDGSTVIDNAGVYGVTKIVGRSCIKDRASIHNCAYIRSSAIKGSTGVFDRSRVINSIVNADLICEDANINCCEIDNSSLILHRGAFIQQDEDVLCVGPIGSRNAYTSFYKTDKGIYVATGCFLGSIDEFRKAVRKRHKIDSQHRRDYLTACKIAESRILC